MQIKYNLSRLCSKFKTMPIPITSSIFDTREQAMEHAVLMGYHEDEIYIGEVIIFDAEN